MNTTTQVQEIRPTLAAMFVAAPNLQWRKCHDCDDIALHVDFVVPWVKCHKCDSQDTRPMAALTRYLQQTSETQLEPIPWPDGPEHSWWWMEYKLKPRSKVRRMLVQLIRREEEWYVNPDLDNNCYPRGFCEEWSALFLPAEAPAEFPERRKP